CQRHYHFRFAHPFLLLLSLKREFFRRPSHNGWRATKKSENSGISDREAAQSLRTQDSIVSLAKDARRGEPTTGIRVRFELYLSDDDSRGTDGKRSRSGDDGNGFLPGTRR